MIMLFANKIKQLREEKQLFVRSSAQVVALSKFHYTDEKELLTLWLTDKVLEVLEEEKELIRKTMNIENEYLTQYE